MSSPIPIPFSIWLHGFRARLGPPLVFIATAIAAAVLWKDAVAPAMLVGEVVPSQASVNSPVPAAITKLLVSRFQNVKAGDVIAELTPTDVRRTLDMMGNELSMLRVESDTINGQRNDTVNYGRLKLNWLEQKVATALAEVRVKQADILLISANKLANTQAISIIDQQTAMLSKEAAEAEVKVRRQHMSELEVQIQKLETSEAQTAEETARFSSLLAGYEERMKTLQKSLSRVTLVAPIDGMITSVFHHQGENVVDGDALVIITSAQPKQIVGYLRQPFPLEPCVGMKVKVQTRDRKRSHGHATITSLGVQFEPILNPVLHPAATPEVGLPIQVSLPAEMQLRPGELVSLIILTASTVE